MVKTLLELRSLLEVIHDQADYIVGTETDDKHFRATATDVADTIKKLAKGALTLIGETNGP